MFIADLHIHSKYSRATSKECVPEYLDIWAKRKGIDIIGTGDFTHPAWRQELGDKLVQSEDGLYILKDEFIIPDDILLKDKSNKTRFMISGEISSIYKKDGKTRKVHNLILLPDLKAAEAISCKLEAIGNIHSDGRPILGLDSRNLLEIVMDTCENAIFIPAHIWTPHFSMFGAFSDFNTVEECFGDMTPYIHSVETGLSSDPPMNWMLSQLDSYNLISNSDAHSPAKLGREANLFECDMSYSAVFQALGEKRENSGFAGTIEFFPEEGKYHYDGHRACGMCMTPSEANESDGKCPVCGRKLTIGVLHRVEELSDRKEGFVPENAAYYERLVPLQEIISASTGFSTTSLKTTTKYLQLLKEVGNEFYILRQAPFEEIEKVAGSCVTEGIRRIRNGQITMTPGYDGEYGKVQIFKENELSLISGQMCFFDTDFKCNEKTSEKANTKKKQLLKEEKKQEKVKTDDKKSVLAELNEEQKEAVISKEHAVSVIAGPGTGKTKTLVSKIIYLIEECKVKPSTITAVTFTNKAAKEMKERIESYFSNKKAVKNINIGTFHSICLKRLNENKKTKVTIVDEQEALQLAQDVAEELGIKLSLKNMLLKISNMKNRKDSEENIENEEDLRFYEAYINKLKANKVLDYDDILLDAFDLFEKDSLKKTEKDSKFTYLLVDEFQDINEIQYKLVKLWSSMGKEIFVIGDPDQSIYGFRGSNSKCFTRFDKDFGNAKTVRLVKNYRSAPEIIECALPVICVQKETILQKRMIESQRKNGTEVRLLKMPDEFSQAVTIAKQINQMVGGIDMLDSQLFDSSYNQRRPVSFSDIAILYRTHRQAEVLEKCLRKEGIPYIVSGKDKVFDDNMVRGTLCFFKYLLNPSDKVSLKTCLRTVMRCSEDTAYNFIKSNNHVLNIQESTDEAGLLKWINMYEKYKDIVKSEMPYELILSWIKDNDLFGNEAVEKIVNIAIFYNDMDSFLNEMTLGRETDIQRSANLKYTAESVRLMTFHASKGLEFSIVFLCGMNHGIIPLETSGKIMDEDEERRLLYVGMTRAKDELIMSTSSKKSSGFLKDIPEKLLKVENVIGSKKNEERQLGFFDF